MRQDVRMAARRVAVLLVTAAVLLPVATAEGAFGPPFDLSTPSEDASLSQQVAVDPSGNAHFVWNRNNGTNYVVEARRRGAHGTLGAVQHLSAAGELATEPEVAVDPSGNAHFTWSRVNGSNRVVQTRRRAADGTLGAVQDLSAAGGDAAGSHVAVDPSGNAHFTWARFDGTDVVVQTRRRAADGTLGAVQNLSAAGRGAVSPQLAVDSSGNAYFTWGLVDDTDATVVVQTRRRAADGTLGSVQNLSAASGYLASAALAVDPSGNAHFIWHRSDGTREIVEARRRAADGTLGAVQNLTPVGEHASFGRVAVDPSGNAHFTWTSTTNGTTNHSVHTQRRAADGTFGAVQTLATNAVTADVAVDAAGTAHFIWTRLDGTTQIVQARRRAADGTLGAVETLSAGSRHGSVPRVAVDASGNAVAVWSRFDGSGIIVEGAVTADIAVAIASGPSGVVGQNSAQFEFTALDGSPPPGRFECSLDAGAFTPCASPLALGGLADGEHVFKVRYHPDGGDPGVAAERRWTVDTTAPTVRFLSAPSGADNSPEATISFSASEDDVAFGCSVDGGPVTDCTSPVVLRALAVGIHTFAVDATDRAGNSSDVARAEWAVSDPPVPLVPTGVVCPPGREPRVAFGVIVAVARDAAGCFAPEPVGGAQALVSRGQVALNGIVLKPGAQTRIVVDPDLAGGSVRVLGPVTLSPGDLALGWTLGGGFRFDGLVQTTAAALNRAFENLEGQLEVAKLPVRGGLKLEFSALNGGQTKLTPRLVLPNASFKALPGPVREGEGLTVEVPITVSNDRGLTGGIRLKLADANLFGKLKVKDLDLFYDHTTLTFEGSAGVEFPGGPVPDGLPAAKSDPVLTVAIALGPGGLIGPLKKLSFLVSKFNRHVGYGVFLQRFAGELSVASAPAGGTLARWSGGAGVSLGPNITLGALDIEGLSLDGTITLDVPTGPQPPELFSVSAEGALKIVDVPVESASVRYVPPARIELAATLDYTLFGYGIAAELAMDDAGRPLSWVSPDGFSLEARGQAKLPVLGGTDPVDVVFSHTGWAACIGPVGDRVGFGKRWSGDLNAMSDACDVGPYRGGAAPASAAQAGARTTTIPPDARVAVLSARGDGAPPKITITGPAGERLATPAGPDGVRSGRTLLYQDPRTNTTHVVLRRPAAGRWTVTPQPGSPTLRRLDVADALPPMRVRARVTSARARRTLHWSAGPLPFGQRLTFVERGSGTTRVLITTGRRRGRLNFTPAAGPGGERRIELVVTHRGLPRLTRTVARFTAPTLRLRPVAGLRVRGRTLFWSRQPAATRYALAITTADGARTSHTTTRTRLRLPGTGRLRITILALDAQGRVGPRVSRRVRVR